MRRRISEKEFLFGFETFFACDYPPQYPGEPRIVESIGVRDDKVYLLLEEEESGPAGNKVRKYYAEEITPSCACAFLSFSPRKGEFHERLAEITQRNFTHA